MSGPSSCSAWSKQNTHLIDMERMCKFTQIDSLCKLISREGVTETPTVT